MSFLVVFMIAWFSKLDNLHEWDLNGIWKEQRIRRRLSPEFLNIHQAVQVTWSK
jgi:hypothetical protein